jgi:Fis family transcriptional regulator
MRRIRKNLKQKVFIDKRFTEIKRRTTPLQNQVRESLYDYFTNLSGAEPKNLYNLLLTEIERPLLEIVLSKSRGNQSKAARWLGLSRGKLLEMLAKHGINPKFYSKSIRNLNINKENSNDSNKSSSN